VIGSLINLYSDGIQGKAKETAFTLSQRLSDVVEFNLRIRDFENLDKMFAEYRRLNPEIKEAALIVDDVILVDTDASKVGKSWTSDPKAYQYTVDLTRPDQPRQVHVAVAVPGELVYHQVERSIRNFAALFVASCFFAGLFLQVAAAMQRLRQEPAPASDTRLDSRV